MGDKEDTIQYQFTIDEPLWTEWKNTVPRSKALFTRIIELITDDLRTKQ